MRRSEINAAIRDAKELLVAYQISLPPFGYWTPDEMQRAGEAAAEILAAGLGWDVTDFGSGDFGRKGLTAFTCRNGRPGQAVDDPMTYCEKLLVVREGQLTPMHLHRRKQEDIICRAGGELVCRVYKRSGDGGLSDSVVSVATDGVRRTVPAGHEIVLRPGESIRLERGVYHEFYGRPGMGAVIVGEVSGVNDDQNDNYFFESLPRFASIDEDEPPIHYLCSDYPK